MHRSRLSLWIGSGLLIVALGLPLAASPMGSDVVFLDYQSSATGTTLKTNKGTVYVGEYVFHVYSTTVDGSGLLQKATFQETLSLWCLNPFYTLYDGYFVVGSSSQIGQLYDAVEGPGTSIAEGFYQDTADMIRDYYTTAPDAALRQALQASVWERRDMADGDSDLFDLRAGDFQVTATTLPITTRFEAYLGQGSIFDTIYSPIAQKTVGLGLGDVDFDSYGLNYVFNNQEFGYVPTVPEPGTMLLLGLGLGSLAVARRRRKA